jgi:methylmalonyl-CoA mutase
MTALFDSETMSWSVPEFERWRVLAEATLKGGSFEKRLVAVTADGIRLDPLYTRQGASATIAASGRIGAVPYARGDLRAPESPWVIAQRIDLADPAEANAQARTDLENGASGLVIAVRGREGPAAGVRLATLADVDRLMDGILPDLISLTLEAGGAARRMAALFAAWFEARGHDPSRLTWCPGFDAGGGLAASGRVVAPEILSARTADAVSALCQRGFVGPSILADGRVFNDAGASDAQELGLTLASAVEALRFLESGGVPLETALDQLAFKLAVDADQFASIAKIRACRLLWSRATEALGVAPRRAEVRVESARRMLTARDPWVNMLRATVACFAGAVGGADEIALHPFTAALGLPDGFARRMARNTQLVLMEESGLGRVADAAGGSGYVETLTHALAEKAWDVFREIETADGLVAALRAGVPQAKIAQTRHARARALATRKAPITGVSEFPNVAEAPVAVSPSDVAAPPVAQRAAQTWPAPGGGAWFSSQIEAVKAGASAEALGTPNVPVVTIEPLPSIRFAAPFEALRDAADARTAQDGARPAVFLAALGTPAEVIPRATFAKNLFEAGGLAALPSDGVPSIAAAVDAFKASGAAAACLCATDETYVSLGEEAARALKAAGATVVVLAGNPGERAEALAAAGVDLSVHVGVDVVAALGEVHRRLGIAQAPAS